MAQIDASSLAARLRLHNKSLSQAATPSLRKVMVKSGCVVGEEEGAWEEIVIEGELLLHACEREREGVLAGDDTHGREVVDALNRTQLLQSFVNHARVAPFQLPLSRLTKILHPPSQTLRADLLQNGVLGRCVIDELPARLTVMGALRPLLAKISL